MTVVILIVKRGLSCSAHRAPQVVNQVSGGDSRSENHTRPCDEPRWGPTELTFSRGRSVRPRDLTGAVHRGPVVAQDLAKAVPVDFRATSAGVLPRVRWLRSPQQDDGYNR
jgi:hypothetical protein